MLQPSMNIKNVKKAERSLKLKFKGKKYALKSGLTLTLNELGILTTAIN